ncbi:dr1-associated corepressor homolog [Bradysia coprophila]|uniref:dr1-associated corepressor homolog n=1 Tax=Bradysia coprophila TaxID=38358 RepID=UPI00187DC831|nr:dr1-associated corepressor homolog [Bradysia coprophila]
MPSKKRKYNQRFPAGRIKKIMQSDEEVGKVAQAVPIIISRTLELFVESLLNKTLRITNARNAKTLSPSHMKQCIMSETRFDFLKELVKNVPDINVDEMQTSADEHTATDLTMPYQKPSVPATSSESSVGGTSKSIRSIPPFNGNSSTATATIRNGNKKSRPVTPTSTSTKPQPLLKTQSMDQSLLTSMSPTSSYHTPNFYTEISESPVMSPTTVNSSSVIQFTPKIQNDLNLDIRPPKLTRIDSAPGCLGDMVYRAPITQCDTAPVMTFDFTKTALPPPLYPSVKPPVPPLTPIIHSQAHTKLHSPFSYPSTSTLIPSPSTLISSPSTIKTAPPFVKVDVCSPSALIKSNNFTNPSSATSSASTSKPMAPILNIDLSNSFNISQPTFGSISSSNTLEMDEDYDNI